jgi:hypothetical protein
MTASDEISERDRWENTYFYFVKTLSILADSPAEQCAVMDYYNVAWELKDDGLVVDYLMRQDVIKFSDDQIEGMKELSSALHPLCGEALKGGRAREDHLQAMSDPGWQAVRDIARKLLVTLGPRTLENRKYFEAHALKTNPRSTQ